MTVLRKVALSLLRSAWNPHENGKKKLSGPKKRFAASVSPDYMFDVLFGK